MWHWDCHLVSLVLSYLYNEWEWLDNFGGPSSFTFYNPKLESWYKASGLHTDDEQGIKSTWKRAHFSGAFLKLHSDSKKWREQTQFHTTLLFTFLYTPGNRVITMSHGGSWMKRMNCPTFSSAVIIGLWIGPSEPWSSAHVPVFIEQTPSEPHLFYENRL